MVAIIDKQAIRTLTDPSNTIYGFRAFLLIGGT